MQPAYLLQWLDHVPDLLALSRAYPEQFPYLLESAARGPHGGYSLLLFASGEVLRREADGALKGPGDGNGFFARLRQWYVRDALPPAGAADSAAPPFAGGWFIYLGYEMAAEIEPTTGTVVQAFTTGTVVQVFLLACDVPSETWSGAGTSEPT